MYTARSRAGRDARAGGGREGPKSSLLASCPCPAHRPNQPLKCGPCLREWGAQGTWGEFKSPGDSAGTHHHCLPSHGLKNMSCVTEGTQATEKTLSWGVDEVREAWPPSLDSPDLSLHLRSGPQACSQVENDHILAMTTLSAKAIPKP